MHTHTRDCALTCLKPLLSGAAYNPLLAECLLICGDAEPAVGHAIRLYQKGQLADIRHIGPARFAEIKTCLARAGLISPDDADQASPPAPRAASKRGHRTASPFAAWLACGHLQPTADPPDHRVEHATPPQPAALICRLPWRHPPAPGVRAGFQRLPPGGCPAWAPFHLMEQIYDRRLSRCDRLRCRRHRGRGGGHRAVLAPVASRPADTGRVAQTVRRDRGRAGLAAASRRPRSGGAVMTGGRLTAQLGGTGRSPTTCT